MDKPRVIFVNRVYHPSAEATAQLLTDLAEGLVARGWPVEIIAAGTEPGPLSGVSIQRTGPGDKNGGLVSRVSNYAGFLSAARHFLAAMIRPGDIVVLMTDPPLLAASATKIARRRGARVVQWIQDIYPEIVPRHIGAWAEIPLLPLKWTRNRAWRAADLCLPVGEDMSTTVVAQGVDKSKVEVMPNWAPRELNHVPDAEVVATYREKNHLPPGFIVGYSGNLGRVHEFKTFLDAAAQLQTEQADASPETRCTFRITGSGPRLPAVAAAKGKRRLDNIQISPPVLRKELALSLASCHAHLVTLQPGFEGLVNPSKLTGILAAGRPVLFVGPPRSALASFIMQEKIGEVFAPGDGAGLAETIRHWASGGRAEATALGRTARECYIRHFSFESSLDRWEKLLHIAASPRG